mmetsp:Transcript_36547/g.56149  ORF Transcript_36547/g.56149 Transcript_36547/m.56149 type:complete len:81 (-) Transcript_36547:293-535(-)
MHVHLSCVFSKGKEKQQYKSRNTTNERWAFSTITHTLSIHVVIMVAARKQQQHWHINFELRCLPDPLPFPVSNVIGCFIP